MTSTSPINNPMMPFSLEQHACHFQPIAYDCIQREHDGVCFLIATLPFSLKEMDIEPLLWHERLYLINSQDAPYFQAPDSSSLFPHLTALTFTQNHAPSFSPQETATHLPVGFYFDYLPLEIFTQMQNEPTVIFWELTDQPEIEHAAQLPVLTLHPLNPMHPELHAALQETSLHQNPRLPSSP